MQSVEIITMQRARDFSRKINATFEFIKQNFGPLIKSLLIIAGPSVLLSSALLATMANDFFGIISGIATNPDLANQYFLSASFWLQFALMMILFFLSSCLTIAAINSYIILYDERKTNKIEVAEIWARVKSTFWMYAGSFMLFFVLFIVFYIVILVVSMLFALISPVLIFFAMLGVYAALIYVMISASFTFFIRDYEKKGFFDALRRSFTLIRGEWWSTFGFAIVVYLIMSSLAGVVVVPFYIFMIVEAMHMAESHTPTFSSGMQWSVIIFFTVYYLVSILLNILPNIAIAFQYFNLVEVKEARGLISQFENIGQQQASGATQEDY